MKGVLWHVINFEGGIIDKINIPRGVSRKSVRFQLIHRKYNNKNYTEKGIKERVTQQKTLRVICLPPTRPNRVQVTAHLTTHMHLTIFFHMYPYTHENDKPPKYKYTHLQIRSPHSTDFFRVTYITHTAAHRKILYSFIVSTSPQLIQTTHKDSFGKFRSVSIYFMKYL